MYAITFDFDTTTLEGAYLQPSWRNAYQDIRNHLESAGFTWKQGSVYFGDDSVDYAKCVTIVQEMCSQFSWFPNSVRDIRILRIEENNDLMPVVMQFRT